MPCPHNEITIVQRSQRQSAVAAAAYQSGEKLFCEYDQQVKHYPEKRGIVHNEILLPANAPQEYADRNTLWNAAEAVEKQWNSQLATLLITSPPYINVFNYHQKYRRSVEALGYDVLAIAKNEFGSNRKNRGNRLLTVIQYCIDMALSFKEVIRTCRDGARMIYVVGRESNVLGYSFCNSRLIFEIATQIFEIPFLLRQERVFKNRFIEPRGAERTSLVVKQAADKVVGWNTKSIVNTIRGW